MDRSGPEASALVRRWREWRGGAPPFALDHRPWPAPAQPWTMWQVWHDLLFAHWPIDAAMLRQALPAGLEPDLWEGRGWISVVPFHMSGIRLRGQPAAVPWLGAFPELNVRTYVTGPGGERPGVYFYSLDAGNRVAVELARRWYHLPYFHARMRIRAVGDWFEYDSWRIHPGAPGARFAARYRPTGPGYRAAPGSLEAWLTERYALYTTDPQGQVLRGEIHHIPWPLQPAEATLHFRSLVTQHGLHLPDEPPLLQFTKRLDVVAWTLTRM